MVKKKTEQYTLQYLNKMREEKSKGSELEFNSLELAHFLKPNKYYIPTYLAKFIVK